MLKVELVDELELLVLEVDDVEVDVLVEVDVDVAVDIVLLVDKVLDVELFIEPTASNSRHTSTTGGRNMTIGDAYDELFSRRE